MRFWFVAPFVLLTFLFRTKAVPFTLRLVDPRLMQIGVIMRHAFV